MHCKWDILWLTAFIIYWSLSPQYQDEMEKKQQQQQQKKKNITLQLFVV